MCVTYLGQAGWHAMMSLPPRTHATSVKTVSGSSTTPQTGRRCATLRFSHSTLGLTCDTTRSQRVTQIILGHAVNFVFVQFIMKKWTTASAVTIQWQYYTIMLIFIMLKFYGAGGEYVHIAKRVWYFIQCRCEWFRPWELMDWGMWSDYRPCWSDIRCSIERYIRQELELIFFALSQTEVVLGWTWSRGSLLVSIVWCGRYLQSEVMLWISLLQQCSTYQKVWNAHSM